jgi:hypothetical protein
MGRNLGLEKRDPELPTRRAEFVCLAVVALSFAMVIALFVKGWIW